ncbi:MAG: hypothetical protein ACE5FG_06560 [Myxococcota bacterium]
MWQRENPGSRPFWQAAVLLALLLPGFASAQTLTELSTDAVAVDAEIDRDAADLRAVVADGPADARLVDTALVFTGGRLRGAQIKCAAFDSNGRVIGVARLRVPRRGLRYVRASDLSGGDAFVGSVVCKTDGRVLGSIVVLGSRLLTDLRVVQRSGYGSDAIRFPLVLTY